VVDIDDLPSTYEAAVARRGHSLGERLKARLRTIVWRRRERLLFERFNVLATCSAEDKRWLGGDDRIHVIPNAFPTPATSPVRCPVTPPRIGFIGLFDHVPNRDGMNWFLRESWPLLKARVPGVKLRLVGKGGAELVPASDPDVEALGWVADPAEEISTWALTIIPLHVGAGTRVKLPDAFSRKCPVVATTLGAYGYDVADGSELRLADSPESFAQACAELIGDPASGAAMSERAWERFLKEWTWEAIQPRIRAAVEDCLRRGRQNEE
jgi:glycosyltransferase involved in cell wall biosynthesis